MLRIENATVKFGGLRALNGASLSCPPSAVTGLIGPNGAGKTTLFNVITGLQRTSTGQVWLDEKDVTRLSSRARARCGLGRTFQRLELFGSLTVRENILVGLESPGTPTGLSGRGGRRRRADEIIDEFHLDRVADVRADLLPTGTARIVELARAVVRQPKVMLLDEISSGLDASQSEHLAASIRSLAASGMAVLLVEHDMDLVMTICSHIYVLDLGSVIVNGTAKEVQSDPNVRKAYLGSFIEGDVA
jgi:branched-chain amino acid transport system ATP-binding protein